MSSPFQRKIYGSVAIGVTILAAYGFGEGAGSSQVKTRTVTKTVTIQASKFSAPVPAQTQPTKVVYRVSDACSAYLADADKLLKLVGQFTAGYGGLSDQLATAFAAIENHDDQGLAEARIKIANMDHATSDAISQTLDLMTQIKSDQTRCDESK